MTSPVLPSDADVFSVPYKAERGHRAAALSSSLGVLSAVLATVIGVAFSAVMWWLAFQDGFNFGLGAMAVLITALMAVVVTHAWRPVRAAARNRRNLASARDAMQISAAGIGFPDLDRGGWILVPWPVINAARVMSWRDVSFLHLELSSGLRTDEPGSRGLDDPATVRMLTRRTLGMVGPRFSLDVLERTPDEIDAALRTYSGGRIFLT
jgi:hypothetical protein